jgi:hypothetical protein
LRGYPLYPLGTDCPISRQASAHPHQIYPLQALLTLLPLAAVLACLLVAWGPGHHLEFATRVYGGRRELLGSQVADLLDAEHDAWFYGNLAADLINFKGYGGHYNHCHRWTIVEEMQERAESPSEFAFCLGYLGHLAADTIAHNHYVPYHLARYARSKGLGHLYWEMRADRFVPESRWGLVSSLKSNRELDSLDELVNSCVPKKALSMRTNKLLFNHVLLVAERDRWRRGVDRLHALSFAPLAEGFLESFRRAAVARMCLALEPGGLEKLAHVDTNGKLAQGEAWARRKGVLVSIKGPKQRRTLSRRAAGIFLEGMETPPPVGNHALPHW